MRLVAAHLERAAQVGQQARHARVLVLRALGRAVPVVQERQHLREEESGKEGESVWERERKCLWE